MKQRISLILGVYVVMALSNAVVPVLPAFAEDAPAIQGAIFSAYFLGAFLTVLPAGLLSDRIGKAPLIRIGLLFTLLSGIVILLFHNTPLPLILARSLEGIGAGLFIAGALSWVNSQEDHSALSGYFFAFLNLGLVTGLLATGWLNDLAGRTGGLEFFTVISIVPLLFSIFVRETASDKQKKVQLSTILSSYKWLYISALVLVGVTGVVTALYPEFTSNSPALLSIQIGTMNVATIVTSLAAPRFGLRPVPTIRAGAVLMGIAVIGSFFAPELGPFVVLIDFALIGAIAGFIIIAQMDFLAKTGVQQGAVVGLFNTATYAGMTFLPFTASLIAQEASFFMAFAVMGVLACTMALFIGRCDCDAAL